MACEPWEEVMSSMVLFDRYEVTPKSKAEKLAADIRKSFEEGMADLEQLLRERDAEVADLQARLEKYEPSSKPQKFA
jgi:hypothetical protein